MNRNLLVVAALLPTAAACETGATFTRTCYEVPHEVVDVRGDTLTIETGVRYIDASVGTGAEAATCTNVGVAFTGQLLDGTRFDNGAFSFIPGAGQVAVLGFEQGVVGMRVGGVRRIIIPPELGYGDNPPRDPQTGEDVVPPGATLVFDVEVLSVQQIGITR